MTTEVKTIKYKASVTGAKFHKSKKFIRCVKGPIGSGKSVICIKEMMRLWKAQKPNQNGIRLSRWAVIRNTRAELLNTTLKTFKQWVPDDICKTKENPSIEAKVEFSMPDGTKVKVEVLFLALDQEKDTRKLLSLELSGVFINEAREVLYSVVKAARGRVGRYPSRADGYREEDCVVEYDKVRKQNHYSACTRKAVIMDTNPPEDDHWWYHLDQDGCLPDTKEQDKAYQIKKTEEVFDFFASPPPLIKDSKGSYQPNPKAENIAYLTGGYRYYEDLIAGETEDYINVMVLGNYGTIKKGKPVYPDYNEYLHRGDVQPIEGLPIAFGWDFGLTPSVTIAQMTPQGQIRICHEIVGKDISVRAFARDVVRPFLVQNYKGFEVQFSLGDPTGNHRGDGEGVASINILNEEMPFDTEGAPTNDPTRRVEAVSSFLTKLIRGEPAYIVDNNCKMLHKGKKGAYCYARMNVSGERYRDKPDKNEYSHIADAEQYLILGYIYGYDSARIKSDDYREPDLQGGY